MNSKVQNQLHMVGACISVAQSTDYQPVWTGQEPAGFTTEFTQLLADYGAVTAKAARSEVATAGTVPAKAVAQRGLIDAAFVLARALAVHFQRTGDQVRHGRVNFTRAALKKNNSRTLLDRANAIHAVAVTAVNEPGAEGRGVTEENVLLLTQAISAYSQVIDLPRGQIASRGTLLRELARDTAALIDRTRVLDDLIVQFGGTPAGEQFIGAWRQARQIIDLGIRHKAGNGNGGSPAAGPASADPASSIPQPASAVG